MNRSLDWQELAQLLLTATGETLYMVLLASLFTLLICLLYTSPSPRDS